MYVLNNNDNHVDFNIVEQKSLTEKFNTVLLFD